MKTATSPTNCSLPKIGWQRAREQSRALRVFGWLNITGLRETLRHPEPVEYFRLLTDTLIGCVKHPNFSPTAAGNIWGISRNQTMLSFGERRMEFLHRAPGQPRSLAILPGTFNPLTVAHVALADAALDLVDEVVFVLPQVFPHKVYSGAGFDERAEMLRLAVEKHNRFSAAATSGGLFLEIARECREAYGLDVTLEMLCGRDAAERVMNWDYDDDGALKRMLGEFRLLVAARQGSYQPPPKWSDVIRQLELPCDFNHVSATDVRQRLARGEPWEHLVPPVIRHHVRRIY